MPARSDRCCRPALPPPASESPMRGHRRPDPPTRQTAHRPAPAPGRRSAAASPSHPPPPAARGWPAESIARQTAAQSDDPSPVRAQYRSIRPAAYGSSRNPAAPDGASRKIRPRPSHGSSGSVRGTSPRARRPSSAGRSHADRGRSYTSSDLRRPACRRSPAAPPTARSRGLPSPFRWHAHRSWHTARCFLRDENPPASGLHAQSPPGLPYGSSGRSSPALRPAAGPAPASTHALRSPDARTGRRGRPRTRSHPAQTALPHSGSEPAPSTAALPLRGSAGIPDPPAGSAASRWPAENSAPYPTSACGHTS